MPVNRDLPRQRGEHMQTSCDFCAFNEYDDEDEEYYCSVNMDEDDFARFMQSDARILKMETSIAWSVTRCNL